jgi:hypothetical protein
MTFKLCNGVYITIHHGIHLGTELMSLVIAPCPSEIYYLIGKEYK